MHTYQIYYNTLVQIIKNNISPKNTIRNVLNVKTSCKLKNFILFLVDKIHQYHRKNKGLVRSGMSAPNGKYAVHSTALKNHIGSATIEATCIMPILLFAFYAFFSMAQIFIMENQIYQAALNTADSLAEYAYCSEICDEELPVQILGMGLAYEEFYREIGDNRRVNQYVCGKKHGILLTSKQIIDDTGYINFKLSYKVAVPVPLLRQLTTHYQVQIKRKAYVGYICDESELKQDDIYVYITDYGMVYHMTKSCKHLALTIVPISKQKLSHDYAALSACEYCGNRNADIYYITEYGNRYHSTKYCSGLKRSIKRVRLSEVGGMGPCKDCCK